MKAYFFYQSLPELSPPYIPCGENGRHPLTQDQSASSMSTHFEIPIGTQGVGFQMIGMFGRVGRVNKLMCMI